MQDTFDKIYRENAWRGESLSGQGSDLAQTAHIRAELPAMFARLGVTSLLDIPCGDLFWMQHMDLPGIRYIGGDIVPGLIETNRERFPDRDFRLLDIARDDLPDVDLIFCRDLLGHFSNGDLSRAVANIRRSSAKWLMATTFPGEFNVVGIQTGQWRPVNLDYYCGLPQSVELLNERCTEGNGSFASKSLGLWRLR